MAGEKFKLNFITNGEGIKEISEPVGFDSIPFSLKQEGKRWGRDVFFGGDDDNEFTFYRMLNHEFDLLLYYYNTFGWSSEVKLIIEKDGIDNIIGDINFQYASTDQLEEFKCKVVQDSNHALLKRRSELKVNLFSESDIDGNEFSGLETENVLVKSKAVFQESKWDYTPSNGGFTGFFIGSNSLDRNYFRIIEKSEIRNTLTNTNELFNLSRSKLNPTNKEISYFKYIEAQDNLSNVKLKISNLQIMYLIPVGDDIDNDSSRPDGTKLHITIYVGTDENPKERLYTNPLLGGGFTFDKTVKIEDFFDDTTITGNSDKYDYNLNYFEFEIGSIPRGYGVYVYVNHARYNTFIKWDSGEMTISASSIAYNTIVPSVRLLDSFNQVVKSTSNLDISFPLAEQGGELYNQRIFNGNLLRNLKNRAFNITFDDCVDWLQEINGDYEVNNETVSFLRYKDFYTNTEMAFFTGNRFKSYTNKPNPRYAINQFTYNYKKYESQKENESENTFDISHGESQWNVQNRFVENKKEVNVPFVRDYFYIDSQRRKAIDLEDNTSTKDDDTIFILDTLENTQDLVYTETDLLQHTFNDPLDGDINGTLTLTNTGNFSFYLLGIRAGEFFKISGSHPNGFLPRYRIKEVSDRYIVLINFLNLRAINGEGESLTEFTYSVTKETAPFISWSDEGFSYINGITDSKNFGNLKYSIKRNISRFYNEYLATCNFWSNKPIKNTEYKNNGNLSMSYQGVQTIENEDFTPLNPILSPFIHEVTIIGDFSTFIDLQNKARTQRGFIRTIDANGQVLKIYPKEITFKQADEDGEIFIIGEEKYELSLINIVYSELPYLTINNEYRVQKITYRIEDEKVYIMDEVGFLMYNPVFWQKVTINGVVSTSKEELMNKLTLLP